LLEGNGSAQISSRKQPSSNTGSLIQEGSEEFDRQLRENLKNSIKATGKSDAPAVISSSAMQTEIPATYCDKTSGHHLVEVSPDWYPLRLYLGGSHDPSALVQPALRSKLMQFSTILIQIGNCYGLDAKALNVYYDEKATSVAFNQNCTLYFNAARFYFSCNAQGVANSTMYTYWYLVFAHELGHNHVGPHNAEHEFYVSSYAHEYMVCCV
jgi:hypothetical protein